MSSLPKVALSDDLLLKYGGIQADPYTIALGIRIFTRFALSTGGQRVIAEALNNLPCRISRHGDMTFGYGDLHILRDPNINNEGFVFAALCGALGECFPTHYAAQVLGKLAIYYDPEGSYRPHLDQWRRLVLSCSGMFALTDLAVSVKGVLQGNTSDESFVRELPQPKAFAQALASFAELTQNSEGRLMIVGGKEIKWFAMIARRFFDLSVSLIDGSGTQMSNPDRDKSCSTYPCLFSPIYQHAGVDLLQKR